MTQNIGETLRAARETQGLTVDAVAQRLRLMHRQIEAMETDDFASLGQPVFARGFVRNYARLLGLDAEVLVAGLQRDEPPPPVIPPPENRPPRSTVGESSALGWLASPWLWVFAVGAVVAISIPVGLYLWLNSGDDLAPLVAEPAAPAVAAPATPAPPPPTLDAYGAPIALDANGVPLTGMAPTEEGLTGALDATGQPLVEDAGQAPASTVAGQTGPDANPAAANPVAANQARAYPMQAPAGQTVARPGSLPVPAPAAGAKVPKPVTPPPAAPTLAVPTTSLSGARTLELNFMADAWVEIRDANGKFVHRQLNRAGSRAVVQGKPPFDLVVGNAAQVRMNYAGRPLDLKPYIDITVARFTLEQ